MGYLYTFFYDNDLETMKNYSIYLAQFSEG